MRDAVDGQRVWCTTGGSAIQCNAVFAKPPYSGDEDCTEMRGREERQDGQRLARPAILVRVVAIAIPTAANRAIMEDTTTKTLIPILADNVPTSVIPMALKNEKNENQMRNWPVVTSKNSVPGTIKKPVPIVMEAPTMSIPAPMVELRRRCEKVFFAARVAKVSCSRMYIPHPSEKLRSKQGSAAGKEVTPH